MDTSQNETQQVKMLTSSAVLRFLIGNDDALETMILCKPNHLRIVTTEQALYEALGSVKEYDQFKLNKLVKLLEIIELRAATDKHILKDEDVERIRSTALKNAERDEKTGDQ